MTINFHFLINSTLAERNRLKKFIQELTKKEKCRIDSLDIIFCSDKYLLSINKSYLKHNYYTDIITFDLTTTPAIPKIAEIYISTERVKENAAQYATTFKKELHRVIFHGILHLCGYKDKKPQQQILMRKKEEEYLRRYFKI